MTNKNMESKADSRLARVISSLEKVIPVMRWLFYIAGAILALYTFFVVVDVILRYVFSKPLRLSMDIGGMVMTAFLFLAASYVQVEKGHIEIDIITSKLSRKTNLVLSGAMYIICLAVTFLTEVTSNTATANLILPILAATAVAAMIDPRLIMVPATISASFAFMLPVATPPNAIVFGSEKLTIRQMAREGFALNLLGAVIVTLVCWWRFS